MGQDCLFLQARRLNGPKWEWEFREHVIIQVFCRQRIDVFLQQRKKQKNFYIHTESDAVINQTLQEEFRTIIRMKLIDNPQGNYQFLMGIAPYSSGVVAMPGFEIVHTRFMRPMPLHLALDRVQSHLEQEGRTIKALCGMELRIPKPLTFDGFSQFNQGYGKKLQELQLLLEDVNPIARTNISMVAFGPEEPSMYAFSYTIPSSETTTSFVVAGAGDLIDQTNLTKEAIIRPGENSPDAHREKILTVMQVMQARLDGLQVGWSTVTNIDVYTAIPIQPYLMDSILKKTGMASQHSINWYFSNPPIQGLAFEMDLRGVRRDQFIDM